MIHNHTRTKIISKLQHLLTHTLDEMAYGSSSLPGVTNAKEAVDWIVSVLYPNTKPAVALTTDLPTGIDTPNVGDVAPTINDYRIVNDDGTGFAAGFLYVKYDADISAKWHKVYSFNWGVNQVLQGLVDATQPLYAKKLGSTDYDAGTTLEILGTFAGQSIYGGEKTNQNLTLNATNFDNTGYVQFNDNVRPTINSSFNLGTNTERFLKIFTDSILSGTTTIFNGTITDSTGTVDFVSDTISTLGLVSSDILSVGTSGTIGSVLISSTITTIGGTTSFLSDNILTTGNINGAIGTFTSGLIGDFTIGTGSFTSLSPTINIGSNNLLTTGNAGVNNLTSSTASIGLIDISTNVISTIGLLAINSTGLTVGSSFTVSLDSFLNGNVTVASGKTLAISNGLSISGDTLSPTGLSLLISSTLNPTVDAVSSIGSAALRFVDIFLSGAIKSSVDQFTLSDLFRFNSSQFRDAAKTIPIVDGDFLSYDSVSGKWLSAANITPDHLTIANLNGGPNGDGGHSVFPKLLGRSGGQSINGGTIANETLSLLNNTIDGVGVTISLTEIKPNVSATISLGSFALRYTDIYMDGFADGLKVKDLASIATLDTYLDIGNAASNGKIGTNGGALYLNSGGVRKIIGGSSSVFTVDLTVLTSETITAAVLGLTLPTRTMFQVFDSITHEKVNINIVATPTDVIFSRDAAIIPANIFRVIGIEV